MKNLIILGAGTAGTAMANKLAKALSPKQWKITIIDKDNVHIYQPGLLFVPFGSYTVDEIQRPRTRYLPPEVEVILDEIDRVEGGANRVHLKGGTVLDYDILIVSTGTRVDPTATPGLADEGWYKTAFDFYTLDGAGALHGALERFEGGRLVLNVAEMPIKCPVAPLEFLFLADAYFTERGIRDDVEIVYATPLDGAFTKPKASAVLGNMLDDRNIQVLPNFALEKVDGAAKRMTAYDEQTVDYDLLVSIPLHYGSEAIGRSGLGDDFGFIPTNKHTLQSDAHGNIFALGDATNLPSSKAGSVAHFQSDVLIENVLRYIKGLSPLPDFDGHANCFIETGFGKAILIDFNYQTEPLPGRFPLPGIGPFTLLEESHVNHWGKLGFRWMYWNLLLKGEDIPIDHKMVMAGKWS